MVAPYTKGLSKSMKDICNKLGMQVHVMGGNTIRSLLMAPNDKYNTT